MALRYQLPDAVTLYYSQVLVVGGYCMDMAPLSAVATIFHNGYGPITMMSPSLKRAKRSGAFGQVCSD
ncbi:MAG: hypothetical protein LRY75_11175 [Shewanella xiamenensis]|uniref:hypothetical protein n=1 Tax=Shewanella xiamenensis TaxID=332186 RepID=UPI0008497B6D|nr:hypothetical protein [Shewanella xiamenensis]MCD8550127.1 hypothetical protein [Shewanella xiamenensis]MCD8559353.1 hypothetical protein [Shewanella xiamenensis]ODR84080.1 hypothetical protein ABT47_01365 [Shewanella xiamenensis]